MNETLQSIIVAAIILLAGYLYVRSRSKKNNNGDCGDCPLKNNCKKKR